MRLKALLERRHEYRLLGLMLLLLHAALWGELAGAASRSLMLAHLGLFLLWQPIWRREERLQASASAIAVLLILAFVGWLDWWAVTFWLLLLTGLVGGRDTESPRERKTYMLTLVFLVSELMLGAVPQTFEVPLPQLVSTVSAWGLPLMPLAMLFMTADDKPVSNTQAVDFLYGVTMSLLCGVLALGSLLRMYDSGVDYTVAVFQTVFAVSAFMLTISWLWMPFAGFSGLGQLWTRYLMNIGTPFEQWLGRISELSREPVQPEQFLDAAMHELVALPWVKGVQWQAREGTLQQTGETHGQNFSMTEENLSVTVFTVAPAGAALLLHGKLLVNLLAHFYRAREREVELTRRAHLEAVHETGARLTHDIKNLLQSLHNTTSAMERAETSQDREAVHGFVEKQLPTLTQRLQSALDKLQQPELITSREMPAARWWEAFQSRHGDANVEFVSDLMDSNETVVPAELFDSVAENLLDNALYKRQTEAALNITVKFEQTGACVRLTVTDDGSAIPEALRTELLSSPVRSRSGFGIGLYQSARQAGRAGFKLTLDAADAGRVSFLLEGTAGTGVDAAA
ncbi:MAG: ATP-binding protein [Pseudomonadota bacterium]